MIMKKQLSDTWRVWIFPPSITTVYWNKAKDHFLDSGCAKMARGAFLSLIDASRCQVMNSILIERVRKRERLPGDPLLTICRFITGVLLLHSWQRFTLATLPSIIHCGSLIEIQPTFAIYFHIIIIAYEEIQ